LENPRELTHIELYFGGKERQGQIELNSLFKIINEHAKNAKVSVERYGGILAEIPDFRGVLKALTGADVKEITNKIGTLDRWKLFSVRHVLENHEETEEEKEAEKEQKLLEDAEWITIYTKGDSKEALKCIEEKIKSTQKRANLAWLYNDLGYIESDPALKKQDIAKQHLESALTLHYSIIPLTLLNLAVLDIDGTDYGPAIEKIEEALMLTMSVSDIKASCLRLRLPENHLNFKTKWEQNPANVLEAAYINLAFALLKDKDASCAMEALDEGLQLIPSSIRLRHAKARLFLHLKKANLAIPIYSELNKLEKLPMGMENELIVFSRKLKKK
jgi:tetratricopeptide (TPR) repeat protein